MTARAATCQSNPSPGIAHSILTSHRIVKTPDEEFPSESFIANKLELGGLIHLDAIPGQPDQVPSTHPSSCAG